jgi:enoyl-CoA hydratase/carnithine racemase
MLLHCDLVYASDGARFKLPFVDLGLVPEAASSLLLPRIVGHPRTSELLLLGETWSAQQALDAGLINAVLPQDELQDHAWERARHLATRAPAALRITKALIARADAQAVQDTMEAELQEFGDRLASPELAEAVQAFMERRPPDFSRFS